MIDKSIHCLFIILLGIAVSSTEAQNIRPETSPTISFFKTDLQQLESSYSRKLFFDKAYTMGLYTTEEIQQTAANALLFSKDGTIMNNRIIDSLIRYCRVADKSATEQEKYQYLLQHQNENTKRPKLPCQTSTIYFDTLNCIPVPIVENGHLYFDICEDDSVRLVAKGYYPQNGTNYTQHDTLHRYTWTFGDGVTSNTEGDPFIYHKYTTTKGYDISVTMRDTNLCMSNTRAARVRIAGSPIKTFAPIDPICLGDSITLSPSKVFQVTPFTYSQISSQRYDSTTFIPDSDQNTSNPNYCPPGHYVTDVIFSSFLPGQTITSTHDILSICAEMEHGWMGDIDIKIICPSGQTAQLKQNGTGGSKYLGEPACWFSGCSVADIRACDNADHCDAKLNPPGRGWNYCWSELYPNVGELGNQSTVGTNQIDSTHRIAGTGYFSPAVSFTSLIGCPLNGLWTIDITDHAGADNGYIFAWELNLDPALLPSNWTYVVSVDDYSITGPGASNTGNDQVTIKPTSTGSLEYSYYVGDSFGCTWDTTFNIKVNP
ncbi:MAG: hypothetical protein CVU06_04680, partial [Bacteroidetes bacterium HGW-Bacteroidetes-22]